jgi:hypothetical protein
VRKEEMIAALVVFRLLYFYAPCVLALITMACWESLLFLRRSRVAENGMTMTPEMQISDQPPVREDRPPRRHVRK